MNIKSDEIPNILNSSVTGADFQLVTFMDIKSDEFPNILNSSVMGAGIQLVIQMLVKILIKVINTNSY